MWGSGSDRKWYLSWQFWVASAIPQLSSHAMQASVCSDATASCSGIPSLRRETGGKYDGCFRWDFADQSLLLGLRPFLRTQGHGVISSLACMSYRSPSRS